MQGELSPTIEQEIQKGIHLLNQGGIVAFPTDTVYGLGADATNECAVERVYELKQRPRYLPLPVLLADAAQIASIAGAVSDIAWLLARHFWPGGLTLVLPKGPSVSEKISAGGGTVAVRVPNHPIPVALIRGLGLPIVGTSANLSGRPSVLTAKEVSEQLGDRVDLIINGGRCPGGVESTVVDVTKDVPVILREGAISIRELQRIYDKIAVKGG
jgi:L-threonylcarbamoyladenylate synthase